MSRRPAIDPSILMELLTAIIDKAESDFMILNSTSIIRKNDYVPASISTAVLRHCREAVRQLPAKEESK